MFNNKEEFKIAFQTRLEESCGRSFDEADKTEVYTTLGHMIRDYAGLNWKESKETVSDTGAKQMYYFSMEFLIGRLMTNNLMNLGIYEIVRDGLAELGFDINELEDLESDAGLGNGGLGRLAACFLDSLASLQLPGNGNCIRFQYGLFRQLIDDEGNQVEVPDQWLRLGNVWEVRKPQHAVDVKFYGRIERGPMTEDGKMTFIHVDCEHVTAIPYDVPIVGAGTHQTNTLRLWNAEASTQLPKHKDFRKYLSDISDICLNVYPDDSTDEGKLLRLKQQYFFTCAGINSIVNNHLKHYGTLDNLAEKVAIQLNDTHPTLAIPELMRVLMDEHKYDWDHAWEITKATFAYTNHTILAEALEKWNATYVQTLLPRIYMIIEEIDRRFRNYLATNYPGKYNLENNVAILKDGQVHMANLAALGSHSLNGVAKIHSDILVNETFHSFYKLFPTRFNNKTNGITQRRWLLYSNPQLTNLIESKIGPEFKKDFTKVEQLMNFVDDPKTQEEFLKVKYERKVILAKYIKDTVNIDVDPNSIFDVQAKRLHAYKRQLLNVFHIIYLYQRIKSDPNFRMTPRTFIFAAKAAPAYTFAKNVIKLINVMSKVINNDPDVKGMIKVVFLPNYSVSLAEVLLNAADVSEQISTAGKEASGTGNMKFMMNGAITLGTMDGANVEIDALVGRENDVIFGMDVDEVNALRPHYNFWEYLNNDWRLNNVFASLINGTWSNSPEDFRVIYNELHFRNDEYFLFADFDSYVRAQEEIERRYADRSQWAKSCLINIAKSAYFSSDRTIKQYADEIWNIKPTNI
ncbi:MAG: glycogen/starch/alpha-glucan phosphorylase [Erysipelotrichaceae bacterium]|mgnify:FL=1|nr:glycogen/starch/alpha-glucan phosphorylase [Erysipelotrichaceae bacterium]